MSHNINPQSGDNKPMYKQVFERAILGANIPTKSTSKSPPKNKMVRRPILPKKVREDIRLSPSQIEEQKTRNPIMPKKYENGPEHIIIEKPDLSKEKY